MFKKRLENWSDVKSIIDLLEERGENYTKIGDREKIYVNIDYHKKV